MFGDGITRDEIRKVYGLNTKYEMKFDGKSFYDPSAMEGVNAGSFKKDDLVDHDKVPEKSNSCPEGWGIFPRTVVKALEKINRQDLLKRPPNSKFRVLTSTFSASVIEMYFGEVKDLLNKKKKIPIKVTSNKDFDFTMAKQMKVETLQDLQKLIDVVFTERQSRSTKMNDVSSRSHCITTLFLSKILIDENDGGRKFVSQTQMQFVDLSGSERTSKTGVSGKEQIQGSIQGIEGIVINIDLWALGTVYQIKTISKILLNEFLHVFKKGMP